jgi:hypothetical protein
MKLKLLLCLALVLSRGLLGNNCDAAIIYPKAPDGGRQIVNESLKHLPRSISRYLGNFQIEDLTMADPYRDYSVDPTNLASGQLLSATKSGAWRYPLMHGTNAVAAAELIGDGTNGQPLKFAGLEQTDFSNETLEALRKAKKLLQIKDQDYELRRLDCPAILFVSVWLHGKSDDIIIPLPPARGKWEAFQPYSERQMIKLLKPAAQKRLKVPIGSPLI